MEKKKESPFPSNFEILLGVHEVSGPGDGPLWFMALLSLLAVLPTDLNFLFLEGQQVFTTEYFHQTLFHLYGCGSLTAFFHFILGLPVQVDSVSADIKFSRTLWVSCVCDGNSLHWPGDPSPHRRFFLDNSSFIPGICCDGRGGPKSLT